jgi:cellulose synthase/poly-beta-1,6-N-acetylglucosamine synthase-like glycosyltransferase/tetratricopeptide (TPR) repeat protein
MCTPEVPIFFTPHLDSPLSIVSQKPRQALMATCALVTLVYLAYRGLYTLNHQSLYASIASWMLYASELWGGMSLFLFFMQVWDTQSPQEQPPLENASIDVFVPTYNEDVAILRGTLQACLAMDYPHRTFLLDDGKRDEMRQLCEELGVHYITRDNNLHAKAGNLNNALDQTDGEFLAILDADHVPEPHFLSRMIGYFRDPELGIVQSPHAFSNFDTFQGRVNYEKGRFWDEGELFYKVIQPGRTATNSVIFAGSAALFRRTALKDVGYIATETITEDMHTGIRMAARGWKSIFVPDRLIAGQGAADVTTFHTQRLRWAEGNLSILAYDNPLTMKGLTLVQRLTYFGSIIHWAGGLPRLFLYLTPILMLLTGVSPVREFTPTLAVVFVTYLVSMMVALKAVYRGYMNYDLVEFFNMANFWTQIRATVRALIYRKKSKFVVTNKRGGRQGSILPHVVPQIVLLALCQFSLIYGWARHLLFDPQLELLGLGIATFLILHHARYAIAYLRTAMTPSSKREAYRHRLNMPLKYSFTDQEGRTIEGMGVSTDLNEEGLGFVAYNSLPINERGTVNLIVSNDNLETQGIIRYAAHKQGEGVDGASIYRYGVEFVDTPPEAIDAASRLVQRFVVAPWYQVFDRHRTSPRSNSLFSKREIGRAPFKMPVRLETDGDDIYCSTRDISTRAMRCLLASEVAEGDKMRAEIYTPLGSVFAMISVTETREVTGPPHRIREYVLTFDIFEEQGRSTLQSLLELSEEPKMRQDLAVEHTEQRKPMVRPVAAASIAVLALAPVAVGVFQRVHNDDLLLVRSMDSGQIDLSLLEGKDLDRILVETLADEYPDQQRLILLKEALELRGRTDELVRVCRILTTYTPEDPDMGKALVAALTGASRFDEAADLASRWIAVLDAKGQAAHYEEFEKLSARNILRSGDEYGAMDAFRRIVAAHPEDQNVRREYAGILLQSGLAAEALRQYSVLPQNEETLRQLVAIHSALGDFARSEATLRSILRDNPADIGLQVDLANVLTWQGNFDGAVRIFRELHTTDPGNVDVALAMGEALTWSGKGDEALVLFSRLLDRGLDGSRLTAGFLDAYLGATAPSGSDAHRLHWMLQRHHAGATLDSDLAGRLAMCLVRAQAPEKAIILLEDIVGANPEDRDTRLRLADALVAAGENKRAHHHYRALLAGAQGR